MSKVINVIFRPHLATFRVCEGIEPRGCCVCDYKVVVEDDSGNLLVASVADDSDLQEFDVDDFIVKHEKEQNGEKQDMFIAFDRCVGMDDLNEFVGGIIESGDKPVEALLSVLSDIRESGCHCTDEVKKLLSRIGE